MNPDNPDCQAERPAASSPAPLKQLLYSSIARSDLTLDDVRSIRLSAAHKNAEAGISGELFFTGSMFIQAMEGTPEAVDRLMEIMARDGRHYSIIVHEDEPIDARGFDDWAMDPIVIEGDEDTLRDLLAANASQVPAEARDAAAARAAEVGARHASWALDHAPDEAGRLVARFEEWVKDSGYPCVGAKSAIGKRQMSAYVGRSLTSSWDDVPLAGEIIRFAHDYERDPRMFQTFVAFFPESPQLDEAGFESALWERVRSLQQKDVFMGQATDQSVDHDPASPNFSLSFGGQAFFVVGLHPRASRPARRFEVPALVFNLHDQFERLRADGRYEQLRETILGRDEKLAGSVNPMLARHGEQSEARQYSGRLVGADWECPYPGREKIEEELGK